MNKAILIFTIILEITINSHLNAVIQYQSQQAYGTRVEHLTFIEPNKIAYLNHDDVNHRSCLVKLNLENLTAEYKLFPRKVSTFAFSCDFSYMAFVYENSTSQSVHIHNAQNYEEIVSIVPDIRSTVTALAFAHKKDHIAIGFHDGNIKSCTFQVDTKGKSKRAPTKTKTRLTYQGISSISFSSNNQYLAVASNNSLKSTITCWDMSKRSSTPKFLQHKSPIKSFYFLPDNTLCSITTDNRHNEWNIKDEAEIGNFSSKVQIVSKMELLNDDYHFVGFSPKGIVGLKNVKTKDAIKIGKIESPLTCVQFFPDASIIVAASEKGMIYLWHGIDTPEIKFVPLEFKNSNEQHQGQEKHEAAEDQGYFNIEEIDSLLRGSNLDENILPALPMPTIPVATSLPLISLQQQHQAGIQPLPHMTQERHQPGQDGGSSSSWQVPQTPDILTFYDETHCYDQGRSSW